MVTLYFFVSMLVSFFFFFNDTATTEIYTLSLHDALPISRDDRNADAISPDAELLDGSGAERVAGGEQNRIILRSEEHTSELQSRQYLVCRLLLEKKQKSSLNLHLHYIGY